MRQRRLRRRLIPLVSALVIAATWAVVIRFAVISDTDADRWTLCNIALGYLLKVAVFGYMRHRMLEDERELSIFGYALIDFFTALVVFAAVMGAISFILFGYASAGHMAPLTVRLYNRVAIIFGVWLIIGTGAAVAWEMRKVKGMLLVHEGTP